MRILQPEQLGRECRYVSGPIHAGDRERLDQLVTERRILGADHLLKCVLDFTNKCDFPGHSRRQPPKLAQEPVIRSLDAVVGKGLREVVTFGFFNIEAHLLDALCDVEFEHLPGRQHAVRRQHRNHVKRHPVTAQQANACDRFLKGAAPGAGHPVAVIQALWRVDADADIDMMLGKEIAPRLVDQCPIRLEGMSHRQLRRLQCLNRAEGIAVELDRRGRTRPKHKEEGK